MAHASYGSKPFKSDDDKKLSKQEVDSLASITSGWEFNSKALKTVEKDASKWSSDPASFFPSNQHGTNEVQDFFEDIENIEKADPARRKFSLIKLSKVLKEKEEGLRNKYKKNHRRSDKVRDATTLRSRALAEILEETWGPLSSEVLKEKRTKLARFCRAGEKLTAIGEVILAKINSKRFV